jgi:hypothetical protein
MKLFVYILLGWCLLILSNLRIGYLQQMVQLIAKWIQLGGERGYQEIQKDLSDGVDMPYDCMSSYSVVSAGKMKGLE